MKRSMLPVVALIAFSQLAGCRALSVLGSEDQSRNESPIVTGAPIQTDKSVYEMRSTTQAHELTIHLAYTNPTAGPVYIPTCREPGPPVLQKWVDGKWVTAYSPVVSLCLGPPVVIAAGETYSYTYRVFASRSPNSIPRFQVAEIPGQYRLMWHILGTWTPNGPGPGLGQLLPEEQRVSNTFTIAS